MTENDLTAEHVQRSLQVLAGIEIDADEAAALLPLIAANNRALTQLDAFDVREIRPAVVFDPTNHAPTDA